MSFAATLTVTLHTALISESVTLAVMSASPAETATTMPVASTVATLSSEEVHSTVSLLAALASFSSVSALSPVAAVSGVTAGASSVPKATGKTTASPFSTVIASGTAMFVIFTPHPTSATAMIIAVAARTIIFFFIGWFIPPEQNSDKVNYILYPVFLHSNAYIYRLDNPHPPHWSTSTRM